MKLWVVILVLAFANGSKAQKSVLSINSPRRDDNANDENTEITSKNPVLVDLPDDVKAMLNLQEHDRSKFKASILGLNPDNEHLDQIFSDDSTTPGFSSTKTTTPTSTITTTTLSEISWPKEPSTLKNLKKDKDSQTTSTPQLHDVPTKESDTPESSNRSIWSIAWEAHIYFSGTLFVLLAVYCVFNILRLHTFSRLFSRGYFVSLNLCIIVVGIVRPIYLFHDPYNLNNSLPRTVSYLLLDTGYPCITTAFAILFLALLRATQIELVSPGFQKPKSLGLFCAVHFAISIVVDSVIGMRPELKYLVLLCQGFFIVWSLLLSAGYFYVFSTMKKIALRNQGDMLRAVYPKFTLDPSDPFGDAQHLSLPPGSSHQPPLARAVRLTLGVSILGSLMGGVQLFGMIKMLGLQKVDMRTGANELAWFGYQVSMRILEVTTCTLLAVIATTPLRTDPSLEEQSPKHGSQSWWSRLGKCFSGSSDHRELEDDIYSEICTNNQSVRQMLHGDTIRFPNGQLVDPINAYSTLRGHNAMMAAHQHQQMMQMGNLAMDRPSSGGHVYLQGTVKSVGSSSSNPNSTLRSGAPMETNRTSVASSRATIDTGLYSNVRSRPSSMLFNDSGFVRFRANGEIETAMNEVNLMTKSNDTSPGEAHLVPKREKLRASQSFDESVLLMDQPDNGAQPIADHNQAPFYSGGAEEGIYEPPPGLRMMVEAQKSGVTNIYSPDSTDIESFYNQSQINIGNRAPSRCSSVSATQSFDMRMYGNKTRGGGGEDQLKTTTLQRNEVVKEKLENPYYYYGSTRNQKKLRENKPRPLLPSQRAQLESQNRSRTLQSGQEGAFQRSRSLGGYYNKRGFVPQGPSSGPVSAPMRNQNVFHLQAAGSMTPVSYSRWQHAQIQEALPKRYNPLYDTPPTARHAQKNRIAQFRQQQQDTQRHQRFGHEIAGADGQTGSFFPLANEQRADRRANRKQHQALSPVSTDFDPKEECSSDGYDDDESETDAASTLDQFTSQATQGYSEGMADNESEVSSMFDPPRGEATAKYQRSAMSPLEYSAMLKLHNTTTESSKIGSQGFKDVTPDSGIAVENSSDTASKRIHPAAFGKGPVPMPRTRPRSRSTSSDELPSHPAGPRGYKMVAGSERNRSRHEDNTLFSSSTDEESGSEGGADKQLLSRGEKSYHPLTTRPRSHNQAVGGYRWDGSQITDPTKAKAPPNIPVGGAESQRDTRGFKMEEKI